ncbi:uracil-DNA glycosylase [Ectobacillus funiculus]|uniref:Uracil-DNA glycosylase n=1 Tax=Ectobacillus funiculus TaxID=137993 RepID=A0ABV5WFQ3_9BACI
MMGENFLRLKEIANTIIPYEITLMTHYDGQEDSIEMRGKNLNISVINENSQFDYQIKLSDEKGLAVTIPCNGVEIIEEYRNTDRLIIEIYLFVHEGIARMTVKGKEVIITNTDTDIKYSNLIIEAKGCRNCEAMKDTEAIIGYQNGNLNADIMFIAEAPGPRGADLTGIPLHGDVTGNNFEKLLSSTKWTRSDVYITNAVLCCPTDETGKVRSPTKQEVTNCHPYLARIIELVNPKVIVTLGKKALEALKEIETHQLLLKEDVGTYTKWNNRWLYPLYHPSPQVINTKIRTMSQQRIDFGQLDHNFRMRISKGLEPINYQKGEKE